MEEPTRHATNDEETSQETLGRRQLLKALAATSGAVAASSMLPGKWARPVIEAGVLPAHAQVTPTPQATERPTEVPLVYAIECNSDPGGGNLVPREGVISDISPRIALISGTGPVEGIPVTMGVEVTGGTPVTFSPPLPQTVNTDSLGVASFGTLNVTNAEDGQSFFLTFTASSVGAFSRCGEFYFEFNPI
jgi:hypothetical protein